MSIQAKKFKILCLQTKEYYRDIFADDDEITLFDEGKDAEKVAIELSEYTGSKWQVRRHIVDNRWLEREQKRFYDGTYHPVPWDSADWYRQSKYWNTHFAHISVEKDTRIAFTANSDDGLADKQTRIKPGRYLEQYFNRVLDSDEIREWAAYFSVLHENIVVKFAKTADEIQDIYCNGPRSCMDGRHFKAGTFQSHIHPVRAYEGPDLAIAYLERDEDDKRGFVCDNCDRTESGCAYPDRPDGNCGRNRRKDGKYSARCVVWPDKKRFGKIYGDNDRLRLALQREGFKHGSMIGARISRIPHKRNDGEKGFVVPYIDETRRVIDKKDHLVLSEDGMETTQYGFVVDYTKVCAECETLLNPGRDRMYTLRNRAMDREIMCEPCYMKQGVIQSTYSGEYARRADMIDLGPRARCLVAEVEQSVVVCSKTNVWLWVHEGNEVRFLPDGTAVSTTYAVEQQYKQCTCGLSIPPGLTNFECSNATYNNGCYEQKDWGVIGTTIWAKRKINIGADLSQITFYTHKEAQAVVKENRELELLWSQLQYNMRQTEYEEQKIEQARQNRIAAQRTRREREKAMRALERESTA